MSLERPLNPLQKAKVRRYYERSQIAKQILAARKHEREEKTIENDKYPINRNAETYLYQIGGLEEFFNYTRSLSSNRVLDIGTGTGEAISGISKMPIAKGLDFEVTALRNNSNLLEKFSKDQIHVTSAESLRGIGKESLAGVMAMCSVAYSAYPKIALEKIDEVLVPGGIVKASFAKIDGEGKYDNLIFKGPGIFVETLRKMGYDVDVRDRKVALVGPDDYVIAGTISIVVAIKMGNPNAPKASEVLESDETKIDRNSSSEFQGFKIFEVDHTDHI